MKRIREYLEYFSEGLAITSLVVYASTRTTIGLGFSSIDLAFLLAMFSFLASRGYAEYLERKMEEEG